VSMKKKKVIIELYSSKSKLYEKYIFKCNLFGETIDYLSVS